MRNRLLRGSTALIAYFTSLSLSEAIRARPLRMAAGKQWNRGANACSVIDAFGRHRLASAAENMGTTVGRVTPTFLIYNSAPSVAYSLRWLLPLLLLLT